MTCLDPFAVFAAKLAAWRAYCAHAQIGWAGLVLTPLSRNYAKPENRTHGQMAEDVRDTSTSSVPLSFFSGVKYEHLVAGLSGGVVSTLATHPFDLIKLRFAGGSEG